MRVNARFDEEAQQQVAYLAEATGMGVSEVLRTSVQHYYDMVRAQRTGLPHLAAFIGQGDSGRSDVAGTYKDRLAEGWMGKYAAPAPANAYSVAEPGPASPYLAEQGSERRPARKAPASRKSRGMGKGKAP